MKSLRSSLILLVVALVFGAYIYFNERGPIADSESTVLLRSDPKQLQQITLTPNGGKAIELRKNGEQWTVQSGAKSGAVPADPDAIKSLLDDLQLLQTPKVIEKSEAEFGLEKPKLTVQTGKAKIELGAAPSFDSSRIYARVSADGKTQIGLIPSAIITNANKPFDEWRDKAALRVTLDEAQKFTIKAPAMTATFEKTKAGEDGAPSEWKITHPVQAKAESSTIESFIGQLPITKATKFLDDKSVAKPLAQVEFATSDGARSLSLLKKTSGGYAAKNSLSPSVFEVPDSLFALINRPLRDWRDKTVLKIEPEALKNVSLTSRGQTKTFTKRGEKWRENGREPGSDAKAQEAADAAHRAVLDVLFAAQSLSAEDFVDNPAAPATYGFDKPLLDATMDNQRLRFGEKSGKTYARVGEDNTVFVLSQSSKDSFQSPLETLFAEAKK